MQISWIELTALVATYVVFGAVGFTLSKRFRRPVALPTWIFVLLGIVLAGSVYIGKNARLISVFDFNIYFNTTLQALGLGVLVGLVVREMKIRRSLKKAA
jgi:hypothetical protein